MGGARDTAGALGWGWRKVPLGQLGQAARNLGGVLARAGGGSARGMPSCLVSGWAVHIGFLLQVKSGVKYRTTSCPELVIMNHVLLGAALARVRSMEPKHALSFDDLDPKYRARPLIGPNYDEGDTCEEEVVAVPTSWTMHVQGLLGGRVRILGGCHASLWCKRHTMVLKHAQSAQPASLPACQPTK